jgi:hypothetical protein
MPVSLAIIKGKTMNYFLYGGTGNSLIANVEVKLSHV